jgi:hypothetical protein
MNTKYRQEDIWEQLLQQGYQDRAIVVVSTSVEISVVDVAVNANQKPHLKLRLKEAVLSK